MSCALACIGPDEELRLRDEHAFQERHLSDAVALAEAGDWVRFEFKWATFRRAFETHTCHEENVIFPAVAQSENADQVDVGSLRAEHLSIASEIQFLDGESQQLEFFIEQLRHLFGLLCAHRQREEKNLYPWLAALHQKHSEDRPDSLLESLATDSKDASPWENPAHLKPGAERWLR